MSLSDAAEWADVAMILTPDELQSQIYKNHIEQAKEQIGREPMELPNVEIYGDVDDIAHYEIADLEIKNYKSHPSIKAPLSN